MKRLLVLLAVLAFVGIAGTVRAAVFEVSYVVESPHPYPNYYNYTWTIEQPNANAIRLHFVKYETEPGYDFIYILDENNNTIATYTGSGSDVWTPWVNGSVIKVRLVSDASVRFYGFYIDKYQFEALPVYINTLPYNITTPGYYILNVSVSDFDPSAYGTYYAIKINASNVILDGAEHALDGDGVGTDYGIIVRDAKNVTVMNVNLTDWYVGILSGPVSNLNIVNNTIVSNTFGVLMDPSSNNCTVANNMIKDSTYAISISSSSYNTISGNTISHAYTGIRLYGTGKENTIINNTIENSGSTGLALFDYGSNRIIGNIITHSGASGMDVQSGNNVIMNNIISFNTYSGILLFYKGGNIIAHNHIYSNNLGDSAYHGGIRIKQSSGNIIYDNIFNNTVNVRFDDSSQNLWNTTKTPGTNIISGQYIGGNAWLKPDGTGFSETCTDADGDGICDEPFVINSFNIDYLPLALNVDRTPPRVEILYPENMTYPESITLIKVNVTDNSKVGRVVAEVDGEHNITLIFNGSYYVNTTVIIGEGHHWIRIYAYDSAGNVNSTQIVYFTVSAPQRVWEGVFVRLKYFYYMNYKRLAVMFNRSYKLAVQLGINNETLSRALALRNMAEREWQAAWEKGVPVATPDTRTFMHLRRAFLYLQKAEEVLERSIASKG